VAPNPYFLDDPASGYTGGFSAADLAEVSAALDSNYFTWAEAFAPLIMGVPDEPGLGEELTASFCSTDPVIARRFAEATFYADNRADLAQVRVPSLILQCSEDMVAPREVGEYVHRQLPASTLRIMKATGHCPHMSHPEETVRVIKEYLDAAALS
jgi:sigma-B regulation protein RsbQ